MTLYLHERPKVWQARQFVGADWGSGSTAEALEAWIRSANGAPDFVTVTVTADLTGFEITADNGVDGLRTVTGVVGDWILFGGDPYVEVVNEGDLLRRFSIVAGG